MVSWFPFGFIVICSANLSSRENRKGRSRFGSVKFSSRKGRSIFGSVKFLHEKVDQDWGRSSFFFTKRSVKLLSRKGRSRFGSVKFFNEKVGQVFGQLASSHSYYGNVAWLSAITPDQQWSEPDHSNQRSG
jgi:hypothetical protein